MAKQQPISRPIEHLELPKWDKYSLSNGVPLYVLNMGTQRVVKLEFIFKAGRWAEQQRLVARGASSLLKRGTTTRSASDIAEAVEFYGAHLHSYDGFDESGIALGCMTKHLSALLPVLKDILTNSTIPERELQRVKQNYSQQLQVALQKSDVQAYRTLTELLYGEEHPYGYNSTPALYDGLTRDAIYDFYKSNYTADKLYIFASGYVDEAVLAQLEELFGTLPMPTSGGGGLEVPALPTPPKQFLVTKPNAVQAALRIGRRLFEREHPDYHGFSVLNTLLGGYFGSRLMQNLREDKGYTYGIESLIESLGRNSFFNIVAEVDEGVQVEARTEIYREINRLQEELVGDDELALVRQFLLGELLSSFDGAFSIARVAKELISNKLPRQYFETRVQTINQITAEELRILARKYLSRDALTEVVVAKHPQG